MIVETYYTTNYLLRKRKRQLKERIIFYVAGIIFTILLAFLLTRFCVFGITMRGDSMKTEIDDGQFCIASRLSYMVGNPKRGDIIVFKTSDESSSYYIKRVIAVGGDTVQIADGKILVNDKEVEQKGSETILSGGLASDKITLSKNQYFVLGDNYNNSEDSRVSSIGNVSKKNIIGKIKFKLW
jgi:signal peptidase I